MKIKFHANWHSEFYAYSKWKDFVFYTYLGLLFLPNKANNKSYDTALIKAKK